MPVLLRKLRILLFFICCQTANAQSPLDLPEIIPAYSETVVSKDLPSLCTRDIFQDEKGRLWLATCIINKIYLVQYDGYDYRLVEEGFEDLKTADRVYFFELTKTHQLLGFAVFDDRRRFFKYDIQSFRLQFINKEDIGVKEGQIIGFQVKEDGKSSYVIQNNNRFQLYEGRGNNCLLKASFSIDTSLLEAPYNTPPKEFKKLIFYPLFQKEKETWLLASTFNYIRWQKRGNRVKIFNKKDFPTSPDMSGYVSFDIGINLNKMVLEKEGTIYLNSIAHKQDNFLVFDEEKNRFAIHPSIPKEWRSKSIISDKVGNFICRFNSGDQNFAILVDKDGKWYDYSKMIGFDKKGRVLDFVGTDFQKEIIINYPKGLVFRTVNQKESIRNYYLKENIMQILPYKKNQHLVRTRKHRQWTVFDELMDTIYSLPKKMDTKINFGNSSLNIFSDDDNNYWMKGNDEIIQYNASLDSFLYFPIDLELYKILFAHRTTAIIIEENCLYSYDTETQETTPLMYEGSPFCLPINPKFGYHFQDGYFWLLSTNSIWKIDWRNRSVEPFVINKGSLQQQFAVLYKDRSGKLWLGTHNHGVHLYDPTTKDYKIINHLNGLCNNTVASIMEDEEGAIWVGTYKGISILSPEGEVLANLFEKDGLSHNELNREAYLKTEDNQLIFGSLKGLNVISPKMFKADFFNQIKPQIYLTALGYYNASTRKDTLQFSNLDSLKPIKLSAAQRYLRLSFALNSYVEAAENQFAYMLEGIDNDWKFIRRQNEVNFNSLPAGNYNLLIKGKNANGIWTSNQITIPIEAKEFFYKQYWFYLLCALPFALLAFLWIKRLNLERARLETEVMKATMKIRKDKELIEAQSIELQSLDKAKSHFFTNISHEFRTPLTIISGMVDQVKKNPELWMDKGTKMIKQNAQNLLQLVNQILDLRKLESDTLQLNFVNADIIQYLRYITNSYHSFAQTKGLQLHFLSSISSLKMDYDPEKILQILSNLISNAIKNTPEGGHIYIQISQDLNSSSSQLEIRVQDTGKGIPENQIAHIFNRFYQGEALEKGKTIGTGIGLALTLELVKLMEGKIEVHSELGNGTTFSIKFPIRNDAELKMVEMPKPGFEIFPQADLSIELLKQPAQNHSGVERPTVLVVEDNSDVIQFLVACLQEHYQFEIAKNGQVGINKAIEQVPDLIVSDVMMPEKDGFELCKTLKEDVRTSHIPIVLLTAKADLDSRISGLERGADAYLTKPFESTELLAQLHNLLENRRKLQERYSAFKFDLPASDKTQNAENAFLLKIKKLVEEHLSDDSFGNVQLARKMNLSESQLYRKIKALTDKSTAIFIRSIRLHEGKNLLQTTDLTVSEIAYEVGFTNLAHFSRSFSKEFGQSPNAMRN